MDSAEGGEISESYRFTVGENLVPASLDLMNNLVDASYANRNATPLAAAVRTVNGSVGSDARAQSQAR